MRRWGGGGEEGRCGALGRGGLGDGGRGGGLLDGPARHGEGLRLARDEGEARGGGVDTRSGAGDEDVDAAGGARDVLAEAHGPAPVGQALFTGLANLAGLPALALPAGWSAEGMPVSVQLVGRAGAEASLLALAAKLDQVLRGYSPPPAYS